MLAITQETCAGVKHKRLTVSNPRNALHICNMEAAYSDISKRLRLAIAAFEMEPADFARAAGLKPNALYNYLSGDYRIGLTAALKIREAYGLPLDRVYCGGSVDKLPASVRNALSGSPRDAHSQ